MSLKNTKKTKLPELEKKEVFKNEKPVNRSAGSFGMTFSENFIKYYRSIALFFVLLVLVVGSFTMGYFYQTYIADIKDMIKEQESLLSKKSNELERLEQVKFVYDDLRESSKKVLDMLPRDKDLPELFVQLESIAFKNNISLEMVDISKQASRFELKGVKAGELSSLDVNLNLKGGDYFILKDFLKDLEY